MYNSLYILVYVYIYMCTCIHRIMYSIDASTVVWWLMAMELLWCQNPSIYRVLIWSEPKRIWKKHCLPVYHYSFTRISLLRHVFGDEPYILTRFCLTMGSWPRSTTNLSRRARALPPLLCRTWNLESMAVNPKSAHGRCPFPNGWLINTVACLAH